VTVVTIRHPLSDGCPPAWAGGWGQDQYGVWVEINVENITQRMRWIAPGRFLMGSPDNEPERYDDEGPQHSVTLTQGYWLFDTPCTQALWQAVMGENPSIYKSPERPVEQVSWHDCREFIGKINELVPGLALSLPTEAQWEYACRAGTDTPFSFGANITTDQVNYDGNYPYAGGAKGKYRDETVPVTEFSVNPWGLYQMHGNVWEWCLDGQRDYKDQAEIDPVGPQDESADRVLRGGSWLSNARVVRSAYRYFYHPVNRLVSIGFRCLRVQQ